MIDGFELVKEFSVESSSRAGKFYQVILWSNHRWTCNCPAFTVSVRNRGKTLWERDYCKHIRATFLEREYEVSDVETCTHTKEPEIDPKLLSIMNAIKWE